VPLLHDRRGPRTPVGGNTETLRAPTGRTQCGRQGRTGGHQQMPGGDGHEVRAEALSEMSTAVKGKAEAKARGPVAPNQARGGTQHSAAGWGLLVHRRGSVLAAGPPFLLLGPLPPDGQLRRPDGSIVHPDGTEQLVDGSLRYPDGATPPPPPPPALIPVTRPPKGSPADAFAVHDNDNDDDEVK